MHIIIKAHCNNCLGERRHEKLHSDTIKFTDKIENGPDVWDNNVYEMLKCSGCENITLRHTNTFSEDYDEKGNLQSTVKYYPPATSRKKPRWFTDLIWVGRIDDMVISELLSEIYYALQNNSSRLGAMGVRSLLEHIMTDKVGDKGSFAKNLSSFENEGFISSLQSENIKTILEVGHASIHRAFKPSNEDLICLVDIVESVIESIYINERKVKILKGKIPPRKNKTA